MGCQAQNSRIRDSEWGSRVSGFGFRVSGFGFLVFGFWFLVSGFGFRVSGFRFRVSDFKFGVQGWGFRPRDTGLVLLNLLCHISQLLECPLHPRIVLHCHSLYTYVNIRTVSMCITIYVNILSAYMYMIVHEYKRTVYTYSTAKGFRALLQFKPPQASRAWGLLHPNLKPSRKGVCCTLGADGVCCTLR